MPECVQKSDLSKHSICSHDFQTTSQLALWLYFKNVLKKLVPFCSHNIYRRMRIGNNYDLAAKYAPEVKHSEEEKTPGALQMMLEIHFRAGSFIKIYEPCLLWSHVPPLILHTRLQLSEKLSSWWVQSVETDDRLTPLCFRGEMKGPVHS